MKCKKNFLFILFAFFLLPSISFAGTLFQEDFEDTNFPSRGWYDGTYKTNAITASQHYSGTHAYECHFTAGATTCAGGDPRRMLFTGTDSVYVSYWMKLSSNWVGSGTTYHPHIIMLMTDQNGTYDGLAITKTTAYLELNASKPRIGLQDGANIDKNNLNVNLCNTSENRAVNGCNGTCDSDPWEDAASCYDLTGSGGYTNGKLYTPNATLTTNAWHHIEAYMKMNSVSGGKGQKDGIMQMWVDGAQVMNFTDIIYRTNQYPSMKWNQFILAPYNAPPGGSPVDQYFWIDDLTVATAPPAQGLVAPSPPTNLKVN